MNDKLQALADTINLHSYIQDRFPNFFIVEGEKIVARNIQIPQGLLVPSLIAAMVYNQGLPITKIVIDVTDGCSIEILVAIETLNAT
jgi:hypothetical protein